jgi:hypothetical protein
MPKKKNKYNIPVGSLVAVKQYKGIQLRVLEHSIDDLGYPVYVLGIPELTNPDDEHIGYSEDSLMLLELPPTEPKLPKVKKFKGSEKTWDKLATELAFSYAPQIYHCGNCGYPVAKGYVCTYCDSHNPEAGGW